MRAGYRLVVVAVMGWVAPALANEIPNVAVSPKARALGEAIAHPQEGGTSYRALAKRLADAGVFELADLRPVYDDTATSVEFCAPVPNGCGPGEFFGILLNCPLDLVCFTDACNVHDICYGLCGLDKDMCDTLFFILMLQTCFDEFDAGTSDQDLCINLASIFYTVVHVLGEPFYNDAQQSRCPCQGGAFARGPLGPGNDAYMFDMPFADRDADLMPDDWERRMGLDLSAIDTFDDPDGDGVMNLGEFVRGGDPLIADQELRVDHRTNVVDRSKIRRRNDR